MVNQIYPPELQLNKANTSDTEAPFLDLHLSISNGFVSSKIYEKHDDFDFDIVNFPFLDGEVPRRPSYAPVIAIPGSLGAGDSRDIAGPKCRDLTFDESRQCRRCAGLIISRQNANLSHILETRGKLSLYICTV